LEKKKTIENSGKDNRRGCAEKNSAERFGLVCSQSGSEKDNRQGFSKKDSIERFELVCLLRGREKVREHKQLKTETMNSQTLHGYGQPEESIVRASQGRSGDSVVFPTETAVNPTGLSMFPSETAVNPTGLSLFPSETAVNLTGLSMFPTETASKGVNRYFNNVFF
jgi:hypothetical protein